MHLTAEDVEKLLDLDELLVEMKDALVALSDGKVDQPVRSVLTTTEPRGWFGIMPAIYGDVMGAKLVTVFPDNAGTPLHTHQAMIALFDARTGELLATMDGRIITAWRTAAVSALATRLLTRPDGGVLALLGSGVQARTHLKMLKKVHEFKEVRVWSRTRQNAAVFARETGAHVMELEEAVRGADVICTLTGTREPILKGAWLRDRVHVNAVGSVGMAHREMDDAVLRDAAVMVEERSAALKESAEIVQSGAAIYAELGELLSGKKEKPAAPKTVYKSLGVAVEDLAGARMVWQRAKGM